MLDEYSLIKSKVGSFLEKKLKEDVSRNQIQVELLKNRYFNCLEIEEIPSPRIMMDYLNPEKEETYSLDLAARSCEYYGGFNVDFLKSKNNMFNLHGFEMMLSMIYGNISVNFKEYEDLSLKSDKILGIYRKTNFFLKNFGVESKVITLN